jgi:uncharacterized membrane protein YedE/YeeE
MKAVLLMLFGVVFGFAFHRLLASHYFKFIQTIRTGSGKTLRIVLTASLGGIAALLLLHAVNRIELKLDLLSLSGTVLGGLLFGTGLAVAESCPATAVCSAGEGRKKGMITLLGGLTGLLALQLGYNLL